MEHKLGGGERHLRLRTKDGRSLAKLGTYVRRHHVALIALFVALGGTSYAAVKLPRNSVGTKQLKKNAVVSSKVKDGSLLVRDFSAGQLPAGPQGAAGSQGAVGPQGAQGPAGDTVYKRTILVSPVGARAENGAALRSALASIGGTSPANHYLVEIEPGSYDIGSIPLALRSNVDVQGSGENNTTILGEVAGANTGAVIAAPNAALGQVSVSNTPAGTPSVAIGIFGDAVVNFALDRVIASASGATHNFGGYFSNTRGEIDHTDFGATGGDDATGVFVTGPGTPTLNDVTGFGFLGTVTYGLWATNGTVVVHSSRLSGATHSAYALNGGFIDLDGTQLAGTAAALTVSAVVCALSYDGNFAPLNGSCQ